jgi:RNA polymerase sigma-70 factor (ECF subfamily)
MDHPVARDAGAVSLGTLIAAVAAGDDAAFRQIYDLRAARLFGIALRITRQPPQASDAVQEAFLELWRNAGRFDEQRGNPDIWLASLVRYRALDMTRRASREVSDEDLPEAVDSEPDALARMEASSATAALRACLDTLEPERRKLLSLAFLDGLSHSELATRLRMPIGSVKTRIRRSLQLLRVCMEGET